MKTIGVLLCGSGHLDGSEVRESVLTLWALDKYKNEHHKELRVQCLAYEAPQYHVMNHRAQSESTEVRHMVEESARIARGQISTWQNYPLHQLDALIIPGGFGVAKNLCQWAFKGSASGVVEGIREGILQLHQQKKPLGAICIAPALLALILGHKHISVTLGNDLETIRECEKTGAKHQICGPDEICIDTQHRLFSTPAYMFSQANLFTISQGIEKLVFQLLNSLYS
jgi:enhancing lycopene biosynthesis protein 2